MKDLMTSIERLRKAVSGLNRGQPCRHLYMHKDVATELLRQRGLDPDYRFEHVLGMQVHVFGVDAFKDHIEVCIDVLPLARYGA